MRLLKTSQYIICSVLFSSLVTAGLESAMMPDMSVVHFKNPINLENVSTNPMSLVYFSNQGSLSSTNQQSIWSTVSQKIRSNSQSSTNANSNATVSEQGYDELRSRESVVMHYYNDAANNCTFGVGTLVHKGPCTAAEKAKPVSMAAVNSELVKRVNQAATYVKQIVSHYKLTQSQFDALVSFTYNVGNGGAKTALNAANQGNLQQVINTMKKYVYIKKGGKKVELKGLVNRRMAEISPFKNPAAAPATTPSAPVVLASKSKPETTTVVATPVIVQPHESYSVKIKALENNLVNFGEWLIASLSDIPSTDAFAINK
jgi:lysozyme